MWVGLLFSARQLVWLVLLVVLTGVWLLVPVFAGGGDVFGVRLLRGVHSAASTLLVVGGVGHGVVRVFQRGTTTRDVVTGVAASVAVGLAAISGAAILGAAWGATWLAVDADVVRHASRVFHFGYCGALSFAGMVWHARGVRRTILPGFTGASAVAVEATILVGVFVVPSSQTWSPTTWVVAPPVAFLVLWTVLGPQLFWIRLWARGRALE